MKARAPVGLPREVCAKEPPPPAPYPPPAHAPAPCPHPSIHQVEQHRAQRKDSGAILEGRRAARETIDTLAADLARLATDLDTVKVPLPTSPISVRPSVSRSICLMVSSSASLSNGLPSECLDERLCRHYVSVSR